METSKQETNQKREENISAAEVLSDKTLSDYRTSITTFQGFKSTRPDQEIIDVTWEEVANFICPTTPTILTD